MNTDKGEAVACDTGFQPVPSAFEVEEIGIGDHPKRKIAGTG
jgi:hypothetical protein